jgi:hypothetical protein
MGARASHLMLRLWVVEVVRAAFQSRLGFLVPSASDDPALQDRYSELSAALEN